MAQQIINVGTGPDSYTGENLRSAFVKVNENFSQLYAGNVGANISSNVLSANTVQVVGTVSANTANVTTAIVTANITAAGFFYPNGAALSTSTTASNAAPTLPTDSGTAGTIAYDSGYIYVCVADSTWRRANLSTW